MSSEKKIDCPECSYSTSKGELFIDHLLTYHTKEAQKIFLAMLNSGKIRIEVA